VVEEENQLRDKNLLKELNFSHKKQRRKKNEVVEG
jgi:hypothetical protein